MTDEQVIKALECLASEKDVLCAGCEYRHFNGYTCHKANAKDALTVIQRQKGEIERLENFFTDVRLRQQEATMRVLSDRVLNLTERIKQQNEQIAELVDDLETARADAVRVFAERIKAHTKHLFNWYDVRWCDISNIVDELVARETTEGEK